jgi:spore germination cell wall hydrolase CwlJ-like protein
MFHVKRWPKTSDDPAMTTKFYSKTAPTRPKPRPKRRQALAHMSEHEGQTQPSGGVLVAKVIHTPVDNSPKAVDNSKKVV